MIVNNPYNIHRFVNGRGVKMKKKTLAFIFPDRRRSNYKRIGGLELSPNENKKSQSNKTNIYI